MFLSLPGLFILGLTLTALVVSPTRADVIRVPATAPGCDHDPVTLPGEMDIFGQPRSRGLVPDGFLPDSIDQIQFLNVKYIC